MSLRTPKIDGLTTAPNAVADANNPAASAEELQSHRFWGRYATVADLPNASGNATGNPAYNLMRPGDVAQVQADSLLYVLQDRGTLIGGDAVWSAVGGGGGTIGSTTSLPWVGSQLWAWNRTDLTQFGTGSTLVCRTDVGGAPAGTITPTVDAGGRLGQSRIVLTSGGGFQGGWAMPLTLGFTLPSRFWIYSRFDSGASAGLGGFVTPFGMESPLAPGYFEAPVCNDSYAGATNASSSLVVVYWPAWLSSLMTSSGMSPDVNWITVPKPIANAAYYAGGIENLILVERQLNQNPTAGWFFRRYFRYSDGTSSSEWFRLGQQVLRANLTGSSDPAPEWNGQDMDQIFLGAYAGGPQTGPFVAYSDLRIFEWDSAAIDQP